MNRALHPEELLCLVFTVGEDVFSSQCFIDKCFHQNVFFYLDRRVKYDADDVVVSKLT